MDSRRAVCTDDHNEIAITGYLNLAADFAHNFTDGLAIGVAFMASPKAGLACTMAVFFHELPHEVGDIAVLINQGFDKWSAVKMQFLTAIGAMLGCVAGLVSGSLFESASSNIGLLSGGGFVYVAMVTVMPQLLDGGLWQTTKEVVAMGLGVGIMSVIAMYE